MKYRYIPVKERLHSDDLGDYIAYGIRALKVTLFGAKEITFISDISTDLELVRDLAVLCTEGQLHPIHLTDVIDDTI